MSIGIEIKRLESGYVHLRARGPCNYAQVPPGRAEVTDDDFHPEASDDFRALAKIVYMTWWQRTGAYADNHNSQHNRSEVAP